MSVEKRGSKNNFVRDIRLVEFRLDARIRANNQFKLILPQD